MPKEIEIANRFGKIVISEYGSAGGFAKRMQQAGIMINRRTVAAAITLTHGDISDEIKDVMLQFLNKDLNKDIESHFTIGIFKKIVKTCKVKVMDSGRTTVPVKAIGRLILNEFGSVKNFVHEARKVGVKVNRATIGDMIYHKIDSRRKTREKVIKAFKLLRDKYISSDMFYNDTEDNIQPDKTICEASIQKEVEKKLANQQQSIYLVKTKDGHETYVVAVSLIQAARKFETTMIQCIKSIEVVYSGNVIV